MVAWFVELSKYEIRYKPKTTIKGQALANFLVKMVDEGNEGETLIWTLHMDRALSSKGSRAGVIFEKEGEIITELLVKFDFLESNNQAEYEALIARLQLAANIGAILFTICSYSQIIISQVIRAYQAKDMLLQKYLAKVKGLIVKFEL